MRLPSDARGFAEDYRRGESGRIDLPAPDLQRIHRRKNRRPVVSNLSSRAPFAIAPRKRAQDSSRNRPRSSDPFRPEFEAHSTPNQSPQKSSRAGRIRYRNSRAGPSKAISPEIVDVLVW